LVSGPYSGGHLNPAVTLAMAISGKFAWSSVLPYMLAQMLGALTGAFLVWIVYRDHFNRTTEPGLQLAAFSTTPAIYNPVINILSEAVGTFVLIYVVFYITGAEITKSHTMIGLGSVGALPVALLVWVIGLSLGGNTGYAINPARDLAPRIMHTVLPMKGKGKSNWSYAWIPIVGPFIGGIAGALVYLVTK
jgi:glycerol uptake facilitator protein